MDEVKYRLLQEELNKLREENVRLEREHNEYKTIFMMAKNGIALLDLESHFLSINPAYIEMSGYTEKELLQTSCIALSIEEDIPRSIAVIEEVMRVGYVQNYEKTCIRKNGEHVIVNMSLALLPDKETILIHTVDITQTRALQAEIYHQKEKFKKQAYHDILTGVPNRTYFNEYLEKMVKNAALKDEKFSLMYLDLDKFKHNNDSYGHAIGDEVLKITAQKINKLIKSDDFFARIGGDEFAIISKDSTSVELLAKKIIDTLQNIKEVNHCAVDTSASIGITFYPTNARNCKDLLISSDLAMYKAKYSKERCIAFA